jgi:RNA polymerase sigma-70 factor (ECF subfamily)
MLSDKTDEEIIELYKSGDKSVYKILMDRHIKGLYNFVTHFVGENNASDLTQETFIKAWKHLSRFNAEKAHFKTWLFTIAKNTALDFLRRKKTLNFSDLEKNENDFSFSEMIEDESPLPDEVLQKLEDASFLNKLLKKLPVNYKTVLILHYQEEMTFDEIGRVLGKPLNTVKSYHRRALIELRKLT